MRSRRPHGSTPSTGARRTCAARPVAKIAVSTRSRGTRRPTSPRATGAAIHTTRVLLVTTHWTNATASAISVHRVWHRVGERPPGSVHRVGGRLDDQESPVDRRLRETDDDETRADAGNHDQ